MPTRHEKLVISYGWKSFLATYSPFLLLALISVGRFAQSPNWLNTTELFAWSGALCVVAFRQRFSRQYVIIDRSEIFCTRWRSPRLWSQIEACAYKSEDTRQVLRIFLRPREAAPTSKRSASAAISSKPDIFSDIDFGAAANPQESLEQAFQACVGWIAVTRGLSVKENAIRQFGADLALGTRTRWSNTTRAILLVIILFTPFFVPHIVRFFMDCFTELR